MPKNVWFSTGGRLRKAFLSSADSMARVVQQESVGRTILAHASRKSITVADVGGGDGTQAIWFARRGYYTVIAEPDRQMLKLAKTKLAVEPAAVRKRVELVDCCGEDAHAVLGRQFNAVLCHSVVSYISDTQPILTSLRNLCAPGGIVSIIAPNPRSSAIRSALAGDWRAAVKSIRKGRESSAQFIKDYSRTDEEMVTLLHAAGLQIITTLGYGVFVEHSRRIDAQDFRYAVDAEMLGSCTPPYKSIARCVHWICKPLTNAPPSKGVADRRKSSLSTCLNSSGHSMLRR